MKKLFLLIALVVTLGQFEAVASGADAVHPAAGMPLFSADGRSLGPIYKVLTDGSVRLMVDGKTVSIAATTLYEDHGTLTTSLSRNDVLRAH